MAAGSFHPFDSYLQEKTVQPVTVPPEDVIAQREEKAAHLLTLILEDDGVMPMILKGLLDVRDPKSVQGFVKEGFDRKIAAMQQAHAELQARLYKEVEEGKIQQTEMLIRIKNSDGNIRSVQWFRSNIA